MSTKQNKITSFDFPTGRVLAGRYEIEKLLGWGWEGEVYRVVENTTGIHRAAKVFYPQRNQRDRAVRFYATKLDRLRKCDIVIQYHHSIPLRHRGQEVTCLISELVEGELLSAFVKRHPGRRLHEFEAMHILYALAAGLEQIHHAREYHGDLHADNVLVKRRGIGFDLKLVDFFPRGPARREARRDDVVDAVKLFYDAVGGAKRYALQSQEVKAICRGQRHALILKRFPTARHLREYLETFSWT